MIRLKSRLQTAEKRMTDLEQTKIVAMASVEQAASIKIIDMQVSSHCSLV